MSKVTSDTTQDKVASTASNSKHVTVAREWLSSQNGERLGAIRFSNSLPESLLVRLNGLTMFRFPNKKREGKNDADVLVSILLPVEEADAIIAHEKAMRASRKVA